MRKVTRNRFPN